MDIPRPRCQLGEESIQIVNFRAKELVFDEVSGKRVHLTAVGHLLFQELHPLLVGRRSVPSLTNPSDVGEITVAFTPITVHWIAPTLARYRKEFPRVRITMIDRMTPEIWELVARGGLDLAVAPLRRPSLCRSTPSSWEKIRWSWA